MDKEQLDILNRVLRKVFGQDCPAATLDGSGVIHWQSWQIVLAAQTWNSRGLAPTVYHVCVDADEMLGGGPTKQLTLVGPRATFVDALSLLAQEIARWRAVVEMATIGQELDAKSK